MDATFSAIYEQLWSDYPNKVGKKAAFRHMAKSIKTMLNVDECRRAIANYKGTRRVADGYVQDGSTFFNNWRDWINYVEPAPAKGPRGVEGQDFEGTDR